MLRAGRMFGSPVSDGLWCAAQMVDDNQHRGEPEHPEPEQESSPEGTAELFSRGVRTALRNNATAYGFSISITAAYGLVSGTHTPVPALNTITFALGAALAFLLIGAAFLTRTAYGRLPESGQVATISGGIDLLSIVAAVAAAYSLSRVPGFAAWPLTGAGTVIAYLLISGFDILLARAVARHTYFGHSQ